MEEEEGEMEEEMVEEMEEAVVKKVGVFFFLHYTCLIFIRSI